MGRMILVLGGARSGKSTHAEKLAEGLATRVLYVATAEPGDREMAVRIAAHRAERPPHWRTLEAPRFAGERLRASVVDEQVVLLDCLTLLASNVIAPLPEPVTAEIAERALDPEIDSLLAARAALKVPLIIVSNELGLGLVPPYPLGRAFRDALGRANQRLAAAADEVFFLVAGLPMKLKG